MTKDLKEIAKLANVDLTFSTVSIGKPLVFIGNDEKHGYGIHTYDEDGKWKSNHAINEKNLNSLTGDIFVGDAKLINGFEIKGDKKIILFDQSVKSDVHVTEQTYHSGRRNQKQVINTQFGSSDGVISFNHSSDVEVATFGIKDGKFTKPKLLSVEIDSNSYDRESGEELSYGHGSTGYKGKKDTLKLGENSSKALSEMLNPAQGSQKGKSSHTLP